MNTEQLLTDALNTLHTGVVLIHQPQDEPEPKVLRWTLHYPLRLLAAADTVLPFAVNRNVLAAGIKIGGTTLTRYKGDSPAPLTTEEASMVTALLDYTLMNHVYMPIRDIYEYLDAAGLETRNGEPYTWQNMADTYALATDSVTGEAAAKALHLDVCGIKLFANLLYTDMLGYNLVMADQSLGDPEEDPAENEWVLGPATASEES